MVAGEEGVYSVFVEENAGNVNVRFDPKKTTPEKLAQKIRDKGYTVDRIRLVK